MIIGIEAQRVFRVKKHGMDMVALELIRNLQKIDKKNTYYIFVSPDIDRECLKESQNFKIIEVEGGFYPTWEQISLPRAVKKYKCDILHCTSNTAPIFAPCPVIITLHDIIYIESLNLFKRGATMYQRFGSLYRRLIVPIVSKKAKEIVTVSNFEKERIKEIMGLNNNLCAIYNGVGEHFTKITDSQILDNTKNKYNLPDNFLFFLGNTDPKKNTPNVLKAFALFNKRVNKKYKLVMLDYDKDALNLILADINEVWLNDYIHLTGYVPNTELPKIINLCHIFLYPSLRESFGIPILEGMACGVPVITSNTSSMPEIAGDGALFSDPYDATDIAEKIYLLETSEDLRDTLIDRGYIRSSLFSWLNMAKEYHKLYLKQQ